MEVHNHSVVKNKIAPMGEEVKPVKSSERFRGNSPGALHEPNKIFNTRPRRRIAIVAFSVLWCLLAPLTPHRASAHGGVIIDGGLTEAHEWLLAVSPYPVTPGDTVITLLIYDLDTYAPINGLDTALYLTPPESSESAGPFELLADPEQYPGDYSNIFDIDQEGNWGVTFVVNTGSETLELESTFTVQPGDPNNPRPTAEGAADVAATATAFAESVAAARQIGPEAEATAVITGSNAVPLSSTLSDTAATTQTAGAVALADLSAAGGHPAGEVSGSASSLSLATPWLWVLVGALPFALLFLWFLRAPAADELAEDADAENEAL